MTEDRDGLDSRMAALERRMDRLERSGRDSPGPGRSEDPPGDHFWALDVLRQRAGEPFEHGDVSGSLMFAGVAAAPGAGPAMWQEEHPVPAMLAGDWADAVPALSALAHPVRLELIRRLLAGARTAQELSGIPEVGTSGQLYHHLRELQAAGLVTQRRRNDYAVPAERVIPCLILVAAAMGRTHAGPVRELAS
jgi:DNA-binding transcriptional ArsR family regulator